MTALEDKLYRERESLRTQACEIRTALGLPEDIDHAAVLAGIAELKRQLAEARVLANWLRAELDATTAEQPRDQAQAPLFAEADPAQQRHRLALVPTEDPPLERAGEVLLEALLAVPGVEHASVDRFFSDTTVFMVVVRGGEDEAVARAILRAFPQRTISTAGTMSIEVDGEAVWFCRSGMHEQSER